MKNFFDKTYHVLPAMILVLLLIPSLAGAGEGGKKSTEAAASKKTEPKKPCFTLLNPEAIPADASVERRLALAKLDVHIDGRTFKEMVAELGKTLDVPVVFLWDAEEQFDGWKCSCVDYSEPIHGISARGYLAYPFRMMGADWAHWEVDKERIVVTQRDEDFFPTPVVNRVYRLDSLFEPSRKSRKWNDFSDRFGDLVTCVIDPESWQDVGGPGSLQMLELPGAKVLIVRNELEVQREIAALIDGLERMIAEKNRKKSLTLGEGDRKRFSEVMDQKVTLNCKNTPLSEVATMIEKQIGMPVLVDHRAIEDYGYSSDTPVSYRCKDRPLRIAQKDILRDFEMTLISRFGVIWLTTLDEDEYWMHTTIFDVTDLVKVSGSDRFDMDSLFELMTSTIDPEDWYCVGGPGVIDCFTTSDRAFLVASISSRTTDQVHRLFAGLRAIAEGKTNRFPQRSQKELRIRKKLTRPMDWHVEQDMPLSRFFADLKRKHGIDSLIDQRAVEDLGYSLDTPIGPFHAKNDSLESVLWILLDPLELDWSIRDDRLFISTKEEFAYGGLSTRIYEVSDLTVYIDEQGKKCHEFYWLSDLLTTVVDPESWMQVGGPGSLEEYAFCGRNVLVARQTDQAHEEIEKLFAELRAAMPTDPTKRTPPVRPKGPPWQKMPPEEEVQEGTGLFSIE